MVSELSEKDGDWTAVQVGPAVVGWVGPVVTEWVGPTVPGWAGNSVLNGYKPHLAVRMGNAEYRMNVYDYQKNFMEAELEWAHMSHPGELNAMLNMFSYRKHFAIPVPDNSLDVTSSGEIDYTVRSGETLTAALQNFFNALDVEVQADLNAQNPVEVVRAFAELVHLNYLPVLRGKFRWRGMLLHDILKQKTTMKVKVVRRAHFPDARYDGFYEVQDLPSTARARPSLVSEGFGSFVDWQVRSAFNQSRIAPKNVIHVRAPSPEHYELLEHLFSNSKILWQYFEKKSYEPLDAAFFLSMAGDPLEEWLDGETISMNEFLMALLKTDESSHQSGRGASDE